MSMSIWRRRSLWAAAVAVLYLCSAALYAEPASRSAWLALLLEPLVLWLGFRWVDAPRRGADRIDAAARSAGRAAVSGVAIALSALLATADASFRLAETLGVALASVASLVALARVSSLGGVAARALRLRYDAAVLAGLMWAIALGLATVRAVAPSRAGSLDPLAVDFSGVAAALGGMGITLVAAFRLFAQRRFELGVAERAAASLWLTVLALALGVFAALLSVAPPERIVPLAALLGALSVTASAISQQPSRISRLLRTAVALTVLSAPVVCVAVVAAYKAPTHAGLILFVVTIVAACLGLIAPRLAHWLGPERGTWITVLETAIRAAKEPDPRQAVIHVLGAIRDGLGADEGPAAVYRIAAKDRVVVDRAGYMHVEPGELPARLIDVAVTEPHQVLSTESLRYIQVQRAEVRDLVAWLDARALGAIALVLDDEVCVGALAWPSAGRVSPLSFEEVLLLRGLADHLGAATESAAQLARSRAREMDAEGAMQEALRRGAELERALSGQLRRQRALAEHLARPARVVSYSGAAQTALIEAERRGAMGRPVALVAPPGVNAIAWAALIHLASLRRDGPMVVVDGTMRSEHSMDRWGSDESPLEAAREGTLVVLDAHALPASVQRYLATALEDDTGVVAVLPSSVDALAAAGRLDEHLAGRLGDRAVVLPSLADRPEDLRAMALHELARIGIRLRGSPMGLSLQAQELLNEYAWPGNDAELEAVLLRAALLTEGEVVDVDELAASLSDASLLSSAPESALRAR
jgi:hypothetical protein